MTIPAVLAAAALLAGAGSGLTRADDGVALTLTSPAFANRQPIPTMYTCEGRNVSPPLNWGSVPADARSLALIVDDPDAPDPRAPKVTWVHWVLYNIPPHATGLPQGAGSGDGDLLGGAEQGRNSWHQIGYGGPCPPIGRHRYFFKLYALDTVLTDMRSPSKAQLEAAMKNHIIASFSLIGTYRKVK